jgi:mono/diheme cytochrome c family protein
MRAALAIMILVGNLAAGCRDQEIAVVKNTADPSADPPADPPAPDGAQLAQSHCSACHDPGDLSYSGRTMPIQGMVFPPNLTPDPDSGIGGWTEEQIAVAMLTGIDDQGMMLCNVMPKFVDLSNDEVTAIIGFLRQLPPVMNEVPATECDATAARSAPGGTHRR